MTRRDLVAVMLAVVLAGAGRPAVAAAPPLAYSKFFGGGSHEFARGAAVDAAGNAYVAGVTCSPDFPVLNAFQPALAGFPHTFNTCDAFVSKFAPDGTLVYSTYLGGDGSEDPMAIAVDASGSAIVVGFVGSGNVGFPILNAVQSTLTGLEDVFVTKLTPAGNALVFSTFLGGARSDGAFGVAVDPTGAIHVAGVALSANFPVVNPLQATVRGEGDAFLARFSPAGALLYSTYLGGSGGDGASAVAADAQGNSYLVGTAFSTDFPTVNAFQPAKASGQYGYDGFVAKVTAAGDALAYSTYLGGTDDDFISGIGVDGSGRASVGGYTESTDYPIANAVQPVHAGGSQDVVVTKLAADGRSLVFSTYLGGSSVEQAKGVAVDASGSTSVVGETVSLDFPVADAFQPTRGFFYDAFVTRYSAAGAIVYSSFYDGEAGAGPNLEAAYAAAADAAGNVYVAGGSGEPSGPDFTGGARAGEEPQNVLNGSADAFVFRVASSVQNQPPDCTAAAASPGILWSPDHALVPIAIAGVSDADGDPVTVTVDAITQDEPTDGVADGDTCPDASGVGTGSASVRAERSGRGDGRVYHLAFTGRDQAGAACSGVATVCVAHDQYGSGGCVDQGPLHDSTVCR